MVQAIDGGVPPNGPHIATATVTINLLDENDNIPWFSDEFVETSVKNNVVVSQIISSDWLVLVTPLKYCPLIG